MDRFFEFPLAFLHRLPAKLLVPLIVFYKTHRIKLLQVMLIGGGLLIAPLAGIIAVLINPIFILIVLAFPIFIIAINTMISRPEYGPVLILFAALFIPFYLPTGTESRLVDSFLLSLLFVGNWLAYGIIEAKEIRLIPSPVNKPLLGFIVVVFVSIVWSNLFMDPLADSSNLSRVFPFVQLASGLTMVMLPAALLLTGNFINDARLLKIMVGLMLIAGAIAAVYRLDWQNFYTPNDGGLFSMWIVGLSFGLIFFVKDMPWYVRLGLLGLGSTWVYLRFIVDITWLAGWLPSIIILTVLLFFRSRHLFFIAVAIGALYILINSDYYLGTVLENETNESGHTRMAAFEVNWRVTGKHLLLGTGPAGYAVYYMSYFPNDAMATHNSIIDTLAQTGIIGLGLCMWALAAIIWQGFKLRQRLQGRGDFLEALTNICFAGAIGTTFIAFFGDWLFPFTYTQTIAGFDYVVYSWLWMGAIIAIDHLTLTDTPTPMTLAPQ